MKLDKTALDRLLSLDDATLSKTITALAAAAGIDQNTAKSAVSNLRLVRASLSNATDEDIKKAVGLIGEDRISSIADKLGDRKEQPKNAEQ